MLLPARLRCPVCRDKDCYLTRENDDVKFICIVHGEYLEANMHGFELLKGKVKRKC